jgi:hypothetical protein
LLYVDNLRTFLIVMVILWHMAITYGASGFWPYRESRPDKGTRLAYTIFGVLNQPYVLGFFGLLDEVANSIAPAAHRLRRTQQAIEQGQGLRGPGQVRVLGLAAIADHSCATCRPRR